MENKNVKTILEEGISFSNEKKPRETIEIVNKPERLSVQEKRDFQKHEETINKGFGAFWEVGKALMDIKTRKLYKEKYLNFNFYLRDRWGFGRAHAYRYINAAKALAVLSPIGDTPKLLPENESQIRPLVGLKPCDARTAWSNAVIAAGEKPVIATIVEAEVAKLKKPKETKDQPESEEEPEITSKPTKHGDSSANDEAFMNMDAAFKDLKKVKHLDDEQKNEWTLLLKDIVAALNKLGVTME